MNVCNEKEQAECGKIQNVPFEVKRAPGSGMELAKCCVQGDQQLEEKPDVLNALNGVVPSGQGPTCALCTVRGLDLKWRPTQKLHQLPCAQRQEKKTLCPLM